MFLNKESVIFKGTAVSKENTLLVFILREDSLICIIYLIVVKVVKTATLEDITIRFFLNCLLFSGSIAYPQDFLRNSEIFFKHR